MAQHVLITGGAGFIGSHLADELLLHGYRVRALDNLIPQVHGASNDPALAGERPTYLSDDVELIVGDVRDPVVVARALDKVDAVVHLAAAVGVGQSMYQIAHYTATNNLGTAVLLEALAAQPVERLVVASSMSLYGEGLYQHPDGQTVVAASRDLAALKSGNWEVRDAQGAALIPVPTPETKPPALASVYALSKYDQERLCLLIGSAYSVPTVALRFFNVYGPRQALSNPYTGVLAIFASRLLNGNPPLINEDGMQQRDFVSVHDVARACRLALENTLLTLGVTPAQDVREGSKADPVFNIGSGQHYTVREVAAKLSRALGIEIAPRITGSYRVGDIRHCFADITRARQTLRYEPRIRFEDGLIELAEWLTGQLPSGAPTFVVDRADQAQAELAARGLSIPALDHAAMGQSADDIELPRVVVAP